MVYNKVVLGATYMGCAVAANSPEDTLVIEQGGLIGYEFTDALNERKGSLNPKTLIGQELYDGLLKRKLINDGDIYLGAAMYVFADILKKRNIHIRFMSRLINIEKIADGYNINVYGNGGFETVTAKEVVDTRITPFLESDIKGDIKKSICAIVNNDGSLDVYKNAVNGLYTYSQPLNLEDDWSVARNKITQSAVTHNNHIIHIANTFAYNMPQKKLILENGVKCSASVSFGNLLEAVDGGMSI